MKYNEKINKIIEMTGKDSKYMPFIWLVIGTILLIFIRGKWLIPLTAWIAPIFILRFMHLKNKRWAIPGCFISHIIASWITFREAIPFPGIGYFIVAGIMGSLFCIPFITDRLLFRKNSGFLTTLIFPLTWAVWEYFMAQFSPYPTFGSLAYSQFGNLPIMQLASITGIWGIIFLVAWFSSVIIWIWENNFDWKVIKIRFGLYVIMLCSVLLFGGIRLAFFHPKSSTVHVASLVTDQRSVNLYRSINFDHDNPNPLSTDIDLNRKVFSKVLDIFLERSRQQAKSGARIILWNEYSAYAYNQDEEEYIERAINIAKEEQIYLMMGLVVIPERYPQEFGKNTEIFIDPEGKILWQYKKSFPVPGGESMIAGDGIVPVIDTSFGRIGSAICFDMNHISFIRQAGRKNVDVFLVPAIDWEGIDPFHTHMVSFRAIENGFNVVRCCADGLSASYDYQGRTLSNSDYFQGHDNAMLSDIPIKGTNTIYSIIGDLFVWICIAGLILLTVKIIFMRKEKI